LNTHVRRETKPAAAIAQNRLRRYEKELGAAWKCRPHHQRTRRKAPAAEFPRSARKPASYFLHDRHAGCAMTVSRAFHMPVQRLRVPFGYDMNNHKSDISILGTLGSRIELNDI